MASAPRGGIHCAGWPCVQLPLNDVFGNSIDRPTFDSNAGSERGRSAVKYNIGSVLALLALGALAWMAATAVKSYAGEPFQCEHSHTITMLRGTGLDCESIRGQIVR